MKLRPKMFLSGMVPAVLTMTVLMVVVYTQTYSNAYQSARAMAKALCQKYGSSAQMEMEQAEMLAKSLGSEVLARDGYIDRKQQAAALSEMLRTSLVNNPQFFGVWVILEPGQLVKDQATAELFDLKNHYSVWWERKGSVPALDSATEDDGSTGKYYTLPRDRKDVVVLDPEENTLNDNSKIILSSVIVPLFRNDVFQGVCGIDFSFQEIQKMTDAARAFTTDFGFILTNNGTTAAFPKAEVVGKKYAEVAPAMDQKYSVTSNVRAGIPVEYVSRAVATGKESLVVMEPFALQGKYDPWTFGMTIPLDEILAPTYQMLLVLILSMAGGLVLMGFGSYLTAQMVTRPVLGLVSSLDEIAQGNGDLTRRMPPGADDELGALARSFNEFSQSLGLMVGRIKVRALELSDSGDSLRKSMEDTETIVRDLLTRVGQVGSSVDKQESSFTKVDRATQALTQSLVTLKEVQEEQGAAVTESSASIEQMVGNIQSVNANTDRIGETMARLVTSAERGHAAVNDLNTEVAAIAQDSELLLETNKLIAGIASQTNLLAMNAAIEAAHAGDAGRGFAVVADEIRKLAEGSGRQSKETARQLKQVSGRIARVVDENRELEASFTEIQGFIGRADQLVQEVRQAMNEQSVGSSQILEAIQHIHEVTGAVGGATVSLGGSGDDVKRELAVLVAEAQLIREAIHGLNEQGSRIQSMVGEVTALTRANLGSAQGVTREVGSFKVDEGETP